VPSSREDGAAIFENIPSFTEIKDKTPTLWFDLINRAYYMSYKCSKCFCHLLSL
jgi:hypothetical protein